MRYESSRARVDSDSRRAANKSEPMTGFVSRDDKLEETRISAPMTGATRNRSYGNAIVDGNMNS